MALLSYVESQLMDNEENVSKIEVLNRQLFLSSIYLDNIQHMNVVLQAKMMHEMVRVSMKVL